MTEVALKWWIIGLGVPSYLLIFLGLVGLSVIDSYGLDLGMLMPNTIGVSIAYLVAGGVILYGLYFHVAMVKGWSYNKK